MPWELPLSAAWSQTILYSLLICPTPRSLPVPPAHPLEGLRSKVTVPVSQQVQSWSRGAMGALLSAFLAQDHAPFSPEQGRLQSLGYVRHSARTMSTTHTPLGSPWSDPSTAAGCVPVPVGALQPAPG